MTKGTDPDDIPLDPILPEDFDSTPNDERPESHREWWNRPYISTNTWDSMKGPHSTEEHRASWFAAWPSGTRFDVRCLDGGAWDRSTSWGSFATLEDAVACARTGPQWQNSLRRMNEPGDGS